MRRTWGHRRPGVSKRPLVAVLLYVCALGSPASRAAQSPPPDPQSFPRAARTALAHGQLTEAESMARARPAGDPAAAAVLAQVAIVHGRYDEAASLLEPAAVKDPLGEAALELALLQQQLGRTEPAARLLNTLFRQGGGTQDAEGLRRAGRAAHALGRARDANAYYRAASAAGADPAVDTAWGALFLEKYNRPEALKSFQQALKSDAQWAPAHAGVARTLADENPPAASAAAERALSIDPTLADAHLLLARLDLDNSRTEAARERIEKVLATNASQLEARALLAGIAYVRGDRAAFDAEVRQVLAINPTYGDVYRIAADLTARNYRFEEAVALTREAVALEPANTRAYGDLGLHLMRTGDEAEARRALDRAFKGDPYDVVTYNLLALLDTLDRFTVVREGDFIFKMHADEAPVLQEYAVPLAQEALRTLSAKYEFTPKGPILVEIFPRHDDFAVRTLGLPGMIGALGACFGRVVTMDSPRAGTAPGSFAWQATLWHELAHVITLQMSNQRVPRWLTEGISVYEEGRARPEWGRDMEVPFVGALERGEALKVRDLNSGFTRPETIALAYYQASLLVDHIVATHGLPALRALVRAYGDGSDAETAITKGLGVSIDTLQASFDRSLDGRFGALRAALREPKADGSRAEEGVGALKAAAAARPNSYGPQLALGRALAGAGDRAAFEALEKAAALVPMAIGEASPHALMAGLAEQLGDTRRAIKEYRALLVHDHTAIAPARRLAALAAQASDEESAAVAIERIVALDPFDAEGHTGLGRIALKRRDAQVATREFKAALALGPADRAGAHCDLGETYLLAGRLADAKREALAALEIAPTFERAQDLLLKAVEKTSAGPAKEGRP